MSDDLHKTTSLRGSQSSHSLEIPTRSRADSPTPPGEMPPLPTASPYETSETLQPATTTSTTVSKASITVMGMATTTATSTKETSSSAMRSPALHRPSSCEIWLYSKHPVDAEIRNYHYVMFYKRLCKQLQAVLERQKYQEELERLDTGKAPIESSGR